MWGVLGRDYKGLQKAALAGIELEESKIDAKEVEDSIFSSC